MASKFPLLEQMRADQERREEPITAPYKWEIDRAGRTISNLYARLAEIQRALGSKIADQLAGRVADQISGKLMHHAKMQAAKTHGMSGDILILLPIELLRFADPKSLESEIIRQYRDKALPQVNLGIDPMPNTKKVRRYTISIPQLNFPFDQVED